MYSCTHKGRGVRVHVVLNLVSSVDGVMEQAPVLREALPEPESRTVEILQREIPNLLSFRIQ